MNIRFLIIAIFLFIVILISEYLAYASLHHAEIIESKNLELFLMITGIALPIIFIGSMIYSYKYYSNFIAGLNTASSIWLGFMLYVFVASLIIVLLITLNYYLNLQIPIKIISGILFIFVLFFTTFGIIKPTNVKIVNQEIKSEQLSKDWSGKKIIMISDVHLGTVKKQKYLEKIITMIKKESPDVVFILGDLIDGPIFPYSEWLSIFDKINPPLGILYVEGNHEKYSQEYDKFKSQIPSSITNLTDKKISINNTQIIGIDYTENQSNEDTIKKLESLGYDKNQTSIILMHDPKNTEVLSTLGASLVLSGHTHEGQLFPFNLLVNYWYGKYSYGLSYTDQTASVTSSGVGTALVPMRLATKSEIVIINIK